MVQKTLKEKVKFHDDYYYYDVVRKNIKKYRRMSGLTQEELAEMVDVSLNYISQIESKHCNKYFTLNLIGRIADALGVDIVKLFIESDK